MALTTAQGWSETVLRVGYQKSSTLFAQKADGTFEKALAKEGVKVEWKEFTSGPPLLAALAGGSLDFGEVGDAPGIFAQAADAPIRYVGYLHASPHSVGILVPKNSTITSVAQLKGKKVAWAQGSSAHFFLAKALQKGGLALADVTPVYLQPPEARVAFDSGSVDAWAIWDPFFSAAEVGSHGKLIVDGEGLVPFYGFYFASTAFLDGDGKKLLPAIFAEANAFAARVGQDHEKTAQLYAQQLGLPIEVARLFEKRKERYGAYPIDAAAIASQQEAADLFFAQGIIKKPVKIGDYVWAPAK
ncbi:aliphatic sulfonate ABC transporter substrate-binding protein [Verrucomicrobium sp. GAS474]|uniref:aliphatic sulfonate ABC transporter substrate-binding protein n=1 Tax=Verrucomicrobium sp. GAS474 TaxID=1882831 RepID=UPI0012FFCB8F|nr:aliphatic sulfonate ABC transporter substrate-binding protein [Verrucomicrobium sp. GAS474]